MSTTKVELKHKRAGKDQAAPLLASFPHGVPPAECFGAPGDSRGAQLDAFKFQMYAKNGAQQMVVGHNGKLRYVGQNFGHFHKDRSLSKYMVGVYNRDTHEVELFDVDHVFALQQQSLQKSLASARGGTMEQDLSAMQRRKMLITTFGSRKKQNQQRSREAGRVDATNITSSAAVGRLLSKSAAGSAVVSAAVTAARAALETRKHLLPPVNFEAKSVEEAYPINELVTREEQQALMPAVKDLLPRAKKASEIEEMRSGRVHCEYVLQHLESLPKDKKAQRAKLRLLVYFSHLMTLSEAPYTLRTAKAEAAYGEGEESVPALDGIPEVITHRLLETFCDQQVSASGRSRYTRSDVLRHKLLFHMCALALAIDDYSLDVTVLAKDLKMEPKKLVRFFRELGCTTRVASKRKRGDADGGSSASRRVVALKVPLVFPKASKGKRGR